MEPCHCNCNSATTVEKKRILSLTDWFREYWKIALSCLLLVGGIVLNVTENVFFTQKPVALIWFIIAYLPVGVPVMREAYERILEKDFFSEFALMSIATIGAFCIGEYPEGVAVMVFYAIGELFEEHAVDKAKRNIEALLDVRPEITTVIRAEHAIAVNPREVQIGEIIELKAGERVPLDGVMMSDFSTFNTAALTGESVPRTIRCGEEVLAGMIVNDKMIRMKVLKLFNDSALARILRLVEEASERKAPAELFIRKFARIYTPIVMLLSLLIVILPALWSCWSASFDFQFHDWLYKALVFLVISCPCALVISIPLGYFGGIGAASHLGILFKGSNYLDAIIKVNTVIFDKTGTLTEGNFEVQLCQPAQSVTQEQLIFWTASAEQHSLHPIAKAIVNYAYRLNIPLSQTNEVTEIAGHGLQTTITGQTVLVGNMKLMHRYHISFPEELSQTVETIVICAIDNEYKGYFLLSDTLKEDAQEAIFNLKKLNIHNIQILSGDKQSNVTALAEKLGIDKAYGNLLPEDKLRHIEALKRNPDLQIAFIGDGMNDAPALAISHVGIAMGGLGSDAAIETADVVIQTDHPAKVATAIQVGKYTHRIVLQNIYLAFVIKLVILILGACGIASLWEAVFADVGVALIAILNASRIQEKMR
ncbi:MAG: cadmium-translocating P-type ATPase [Bacteroidales bacterium]|jgi:Cd2+/Zn2+-exporting ATPase|nr:cadmium-translocating P-type ATPase [Bacteroidales bacterium]